MKKLIFILLLIPLLAGCGTPELREGVTYFTPQVTGKVKIIYVLEGDHWEPVLDHSFTEGKLYAVIYRR